MFFSKFPIIINAVIFFMVFNIRGIRLRILELWNFAVDIDKKGNPPKNKKGIPV